MAQPATITFKVSIAWWWQLYAFGVRLMSMMTLMEPDEEKVAYWAKKAIRLTIVPNDRPH